MSVEIKIPSVGESVSEVELGEWLKKEGETVRADEILVMLESDKATMELPAPQSGVLTKIIKKQGDSATIGEVIAVLEAVSSTSAAQSSGSSPKNSTPEDARGPSSEVGQQSGTALAPPDAKIDYVQPPKNEMLSGKPVQPPSEEKELAQARIMPAAQREIAQNGLDASTIRGTGPGGRVLKEDAVQAAQSKNTAAKTEAPPSFSGVSTSAPVVSLQGTEADEEVVRMTPLRRKIAQRLVEAQQTGALLTTFNEIDMSAAMALRKEHQETFQTKYGIKLGFMSIFIKAAIDALKLFPAVNAEIRGDSIVYKNHYDIGVAIGGGKALVVPVLRRAERMSFAEIEMAIAEYANRVKNGKITPDELIGGTFTITNGGVYGSLLSTPIVNPPQSGILGMHTIQERPIALNGQVVIRPMMYIALTYDHRIVDGREAVSFLKRIKECVENPSRMLLEV